MTFHYILCYILGIKIPKKIISVNLPIWMDAAVRDLAQKHKRSASGEIEFLIEEAIKNNMPEVYAQQYEESSGGKPAA